MSDSGAMSEKYEHVAKQITDQLAANTKKIEEIEARVDKIVCICRDAKISLPIEVTNAISKSLKEARGNSGDSKCIE